MILPTLAAVLAFVVGHPVAYTCAPLPGNASGEAWYAPDLERVQFAPWVCSAMTDDGYSLLGRRWYAQGVLIVLHEAEHVSGQEADEATVQCRALRDLPGVLAALLPHSDGVERFTSARVVATMTAWADSFAAMTMRAYQGGECFQ